MAGFGVDFFPIRRLGKRRQTARPFTAFAADSVLIHLETRQPQPSTGTWDRRDRDHPNLGLQVWSMNRFISVVLGCAQKRALHGTFTFNDPDIYVRIGVIFEHVLDGYGDNITRQESRVVNSSH